MTIIIFVVILSILVFVHEFGHFFVARKSGITVEEFGFGFPPRIIGWKKRGTIYSLNWIPFGGFVRLRGEQGDQKNAPPDSLVRASYRRQLATMAAGVTMNFLLAWLLLTGTLISGVKTDSSTLPHDKFARVGSSAVEAVVTKAGAADAAGLRSGDVVATVNGQILTTTQQVIEYVKQSNYPALTVVVRRAQQLVTVSVQPKQQADQPRYGFGIQSTNAVRYPWYVAPWYGLQTTVQLVGQTIAGLWKLLVDLIFTAQVSADVAGPIGIAVLTGQVVQYGFIATLQFMAILSISLAVVNFLPIPALDGGRALFLTIGKLRGRPINARVEATIHAVGFYSLLLLIVLLSVRDFSRFNLLQQLRSTFQ